MFVDRPARTYFAMETEPNYSSIGRPSSATMTIVGMRLTGSGLPAIRDATRMQVNVLAGLSAVMM
jgi:hypothetical protein